MKHLLLSFIALLGHVALFAQCAISVQLDNATGCGPDEGFYVATTGGTPPYNLLVVGHSLIAG